MIFFDKIGQHFSTSEDLLGPIIMPLLLEKGINLLDSLVEDHHQLLPDLLILYSFLTEG